MRYITINTLQNNEQFFRFTNGDEAAMSYICNQFHAPLMHYGRRLLADDFEVATIVQEAFIRLWLFRHRITSMLHAFRFLRLVIRWKCCDWYRNPANQFRRRCLLSSDVLDSAFAFDNNEPVHSLHKEQATIIWKAIPYLPQTKQTLLRLHFHYGFSCKQIASRFNTSNTAISIELQKSLEHLKAIIHTNKKLPTPPSFKKQAAANASEEGETVQQKILCLRMHEKKTFQQIASILNMDATEVQRQYLLAWKENKDNKQQSLTTV